MSKKASTKKDEPILELLTADGLQLVKAKQVVYLKSQSTKGRDRHCECTYYPKGSKTVRVVRLLGQTIGYFLKKAADWPKDVKRGQLVNFRHVEGFGKKGAILFHAWELNGNCTVRRSLVWEFEFMLRAERNR